LTHSPTIPPKKLRSRFGPRILLLLLVPVLAFAIYLYRELDYTIYEELSAIPPAIPPFVAPEAARQVDGIFKQNQTIMEVLMEQGLSGFLVQRIIDCARPDYNLAMVKADYPYHIRFDSDDRFLDFQYPVDSDRYLTVSYEYGKDSIASVIKPFPYEIRMEEASAVIESSLFQSIMDSGEKDQLAIELEDIFNSDVDFYIDIQKGDSFKVIVEKKYLDNEFSKYGAIMAASFVNRGKRILAFRFEDKNGKPAYYDQEGKALKKSFLKSPLKFTRISSRFSLARRHPITKKVQPHLGVDYAAPVGTPVRAVASGVVASAGSDGANGKFVKLRHSREYETAYLHLSKIAVKSGARVGQGEVIGYVGSTGLSTGPHLDFRIKRKGQALNPLKMIFPPGDPVPSEMFGQFASVRDQWMDRLISE
jgi:murein DD-endopeptidase MepM/ murein hydrolase activator NlpD